MTARLVENSDVGCLRCLSDSVLFGSACLDPANGNCMVVACAAGMLTDGVCVECQAAVPHCSACSASFCTACDDGFVVDATGGCVKATSCGTAMPTMP